MVNIALGNADVSGCTAGDANNDHQITIDEILAAVNNALNGCPAVPTATPTATSTATGSPPPQTSPGPGAAVSGQTTLAIGTVTVIGDVVAAIANGYELSAASSAASSIDLPMKPADIGLGQGVGSCPLGGTATKTGSSPLTGITVTFPNNDCAVATFDGKVTFGGMASFGILPGVNVAVTATYSDLAGTTLFEEATANVTGTLAGLPTTDGNCFVTEIGFTLTGSLGTTMSPPGGPNVEVTFNSTTLAVSNITFSPSCVPTAYDLTLNGPGTLLAPSGPPVDVTFNQLKLHVDSSANPTTLTVNGGMNSPCFGGTGAATLSTSTALSIPTHQNCPTAGLITATLPQGTATISFAQDGSVTIQSPTENLTAPNCLDPSLLMCVA